ncbi:MAG: thioredoxin [Saprospiraceae bacterium]
MQYSQLINQDLPVVIDFHALWCGPCKMMAPMMEQIKEEYQDKIKIYKIDIDKNQAISEKYNIQAVPTIMIFRKGQMLWRVAGVPGKNELITQINKALQ